MLEDKIQELLNKYSNNCHDKKTNIKIKNEECEKMLKYIQSKLLPEQKNIKHQK
jgi:hypothetical protein